MTKNKMRRVLIVLALPSAICISEAVSWWWMNPSESMEDRKVLQYLFPSESPTVRVVEISASAVKALRCDHSLGGWLEGDGGAKINVNYFEWNHGCAGFYGHKPERCMKKKVGEVVAFLPERRVTVENSEVVFDVTEFTDEAGRPLFVFKLTWMEGSEGINHLRSFHSVQTQRILSAAKRKRQNARVLMLGVFGAEDEQTAWNLAETLIIDDLSFVSFKE
ncbi:hypothetical protein N9086_00650 [Akkermansiaceae bacterium]|nr:hypothetical protein [Akkermansiaceae bacterium]